MFQALLPIIESHQTIILHRHAKPDGDALGSQTGLKRILQDNFPHKTVYAVGDDPGFFSFLEGAKMDVIPDSAYEGALAIILDCGSPALISDERYKTAACTIRIDHHIFCGKIAQEEVIDASFESACGMVVALAEALGLSISPAAARSLYTGMVTDSGRFRYDSTSARTFRLAAALLETGIDTGDIFNILYADDYEKKKLKALFVLKIRFTEKKVAYIHTTRQELEELGLTPFSASRGMVNTMADIRGTDIWVNFTESEDGILCELRSNGPNINPIAVKYGGGGHAKASGATVPDYATAMAMLHDLDALVGEEK